MSPTTQNSPEDLPIQETSTGSNEGIERVLATSLDEFARSGQLLIHDTTNGSSEIPIEEIELSDKNVTVTEDNDKTLATTFVPNVEELPRVTFTTNSPRFTEFINMVRDATTPNPKLKRRKIELMLICLIIFLKEIRRPTRQKGKIEKETKSCLSPTRIVLIPHMPETVLNPKKKQYNKLLSRGKKF